MHFACRVHGVDTISVSCVGFASQRLAVTDGHMDIWLEELQVELGQALIATVGPSEMENQELRSGELMQQLDRRLACRVGFGSGADSASDQRTVGLALLCWRMASRNKADVGAATTVSGGAKLQVANTWTAGGGHVWMGPESAGGGLRFGRHRC